MGWASPRSHSSDADLRPGIELVLELVGFHEQLAGADLVITGEGALDEQTLHGKAVAGVAAAAARAPRLGRGTSGSRWLRCVGSTGSTTSNYERPAWLRRTR